MAAALHSSVVNNSHSLKQFVVALVVYTHIVLNIAINFRIISITTNLVVAFHLFVDYSAKETNNHGALNALKIVLLGEHYWLVP